MQFLAADPHADGSTTGDLGNEGRFVLDQESPDGWQRGHHALSHFRTLRIYSRKREQTHASLLHCKQSGHTISDPLVSCQDDPFPCPHYWQPIFILGILGEMIIMDFHRDVSLTQGVGNDPLS